MQKSQITKSEPDGRGHWGRFGGRYVPEVLVAPLEELTEEFTRARQDNNFWRELNQLLRDYAGRPTPLFHARRLTAHAGGAQIYLKREDLLHTGAHEKTACDRGNGRRPTRRCDGNSLRAVWIALRDLHGRRRRTAAGAERFPDAIAWSRSDHGKRGHAHAEGRDQRSAARLGNERARHLLLVRQRAWSASLSTDGTRVSKRNRARGARTNFVRDRKITTRAHSLRGWRLKCDRPISSVHCRRTGQTDRCGGWRARRFARRTRRQISHWREERRRLHRRFARHYVLCAAGPERSNRDNAFDLSRTGLFGDRA